MCANYRPKFTLSFRFVISSNQKIAAFAVDLTKSYDEISAKFTEGLLSQPPVDVLINNTGGSVDEAFDKLPVETFENQMKLNYLSAVHVTRYFFDDLKQRGVGSTEGLRETFVCHTVILWFFPIPRLPFGFRLVSGGPTGTFRLLGLFADQIRPAGAGRSPADGIEALQRLGYGSLPAEHADRRVRRRNENDARTNAAHFRYFRSVSAQRGRRANFKRFRRRALFQLHRGRRMDVGHAQLRNGSGNELPRLFVSNLAQRTV